MHPLHRLTSVAAALILTVSAAFAPFPARAATSYTLTNSVVLGGEGGWDYLVYDRAHRHLFISRGTHVMVVDPAGTVVGDLAGTGGVHGIAIAADLNEGFTSNGRDGSVTVFDLQTLKTIETIPIAGKNPDCIIYDTPSKRVFTFNGGSNDATAIDAVGLKVVGTIALPGRPEFAVSNQNGVLFDNIEDKNEIVAIDAKTDQLINTWPIEPCDGPSGLSIDVAHARLFAVCSNKLMAVVDALNGKVVATPAIGAGPDASAFDPATQLAFSSNGRDGTLTVVHEDSPYAFSVAQTATTKAGGRTMALDPVTHTIYLVTANIVLGPPAPGETRPTRTITPGTFTLLVMSGP
jgi:DNA-binding beta-propeller fold protein YncE